MSSIRACKLLQKLVALFRSSCSTVGHVLLCLSFSTYQAWLLMPAGWKRSQWLFLADQTVDTHDAWLLAVQLEGPAEAIDWVDPDADVGAIMSLRHAPCAALGYQ